MMSYRIDFDAQKCTGCMACILSCSVKKNDMYSYNLAHLLMQRDEAIALSDLHFCSNCKSHDCLDACPVEAIKYNDIYNIPLIDQALCVQCGACVAACPYGLIKVQNDGTIIKCDLCSGQPACVKACIPEALVLKKNIKE